jgi:putative iron-dependent peroxidase
VVLAWRRSFTRYEAIAALRNAIYACELPGVEEMDDAPVSAHVKRTAQESFSPEAFVVRRSMPWSSGRAAGLMFVAFGSSVDAFEAQLRRMVGLEDGMTDALFRHVAPRHRMPCLVPAHGR